MKNSILKVLRLHPYIYFVVITSFIIGCYWVFFASDRYVSSAHLVVQKTDLPSGQGMDVSGMLAGVLGSNSSPDQHFLQDYLLSKDVLLKLDEKLKLREHYSDSHRDMFSRLWRTEIEWFHRYYLQHTEVYLDQSTGILNLSAQAYDAKTAYFIVENLVQEGELFMNGLAHSLAQDQVDFLEKEVKDIKTKALLARQNVIAYQNSHGLISPQANAESLITTLAMLESRRIELDTQRNALRSYLVPNHPSIVQLDQQIAAIQKQSELEKAKLAAPTGKALNSKIEEFQRLQFDALFEEEVYKTALSALERGRIEASRTIKKVVVIQRPTLPEYPEEPRRYYNFLVYSLFVFVFVGIVHLLVSIVQEHKD